MIIPPDSTISCPHSTLYSFGAISRCRASAISEIVPGQKVLFAGAGGAEDAILAAIAGAKVTILDLSPKMVGLCQKRVSQIASEHPIKVICQNVLDHHQHEHYDIVVANFSLNVFSPDLMQEILTHLTSCTRMGGKLIIGDFAPAEGRDFWDPFRRAYYGLAAFFFILLAGNARHPIYDYKILFSKNKLKFIARKDFSFAGVFPRWFCSLVAMKEHIGEK